MSCPASTLSRSPCRAVTAVTALLNLPISVAQLVGLVLTYAEQRGWEAPVSTAQLATELD